MGSLANKEMNYLLVKTQGWSLIKLNSFGGIREEESVVKIIHNFFVFILIYFNGDEMNL